MLCFMFYILHFTFYVLHFMFYILRFMFHLSRFMFYALPFAKLIPCSHRLKLKLVFDATFLHEKMCYVLRLTIYLTQISTLLDQNCANYWGSILSWNKVLCFTIYLAWNNNSCFMYYLCEIPPFCPYRLSEFWCDILLWNNVLCFTIYLPQFSVELFLRQHSVMKQCFIFYVLPFKNSIHPLKYV